MPIFTFGDTAGPAGPPGPAGPVDGNGILEGSLIVSVSPGYAGSNPKIYSTISAAITALTGSVSASAPGYIFVGPGTYPEDISVPDFIHILGAGIGASIITGDATAGTDIVTVTCCGSISGFLIHPDLADKRSGLYTIGAVSGPTTLGSETFLSVDDTNASFEFTDSAFLWDASGASYLITYLNLGAKAADALHAASGSTGNLIVSNIITAASGRHYFIEGSIFTTLTGASLGAIEVNTPGVWVRGGAMAYPPAAVSGTGTFLSFSPVEQMSFVNNVGILGTLTNANLAISAVATQPINTMHTWEGQAIVGGTLYGTPSGGWPLHSANVTIQRVYIQAQIAPTGADLLVTLARMTAAVVETTQVATLTAGNTEQITILSTPLDIPSDKQLRVYISQKGSTLPGESIKVIPQCFM